MRALLKIHGKHVHLFNVHLDAHGAPARKDQLKALVEQLPKPYSANHVIIAGDYNIDYKYVPIPLPLFFFLGTW
jgi:endonuclease/exonuclease/phosphatase family metal-dependent hydrolase